MSPLGVEIYVGPGRRKLGQEEAIEDAIEQAKKSVAHPAGMVFPTRANRTFKGDYVISGYYDHETEEVGRIAAAINEIEGLSAKVVSYEPTPTGDQ